MERGRDGEEEGWRGRGMERGRGGEGERGRGGRESGRKGDIFQGTKLSYFKNVVQYVMQVIDKSSSEKLFFERELPWNILFCRPLQVVSMRGSGSRR